MEHIANSHTLFRQRLLSCCGLYRGALDGIAGPATAAAEQAFHARSEAIAAELGRFDRRTESNLLTLRLDAQRAARRSLGAIRAAGFDARIVSGTRSYAEQAALYARGRFGSRAARVTNADAGQSWHNFGLAWDIGLFEGGRYVARDGRPYRAAAAHGKIPGVSWGGDWVRPLCDLPHYQLVPPGSSVAAARASFEAGGRA